MVVRAARALHCTDLQGSTDLVNITTVLPNFNFNLMHCTALQCTAHHTAPLYLTCPVPALLMYYTAQHYAITFIPPDHMPIEYLRC
jgi:hypothetical protein